MSHPRKKDIDDLFAVIVQLETLDEARRFFRDLLTESEIREFAERWKAAQMLAAGQSYADIERETGLSSRTIARVNKWLHQGKGGYTLMMKRLGK